MVKEGWRGEGEYPILTLVRLVRRARLVNMHKAPSTPMPFYLCVCARARV